MTKENRKLRSELIKETNKDMIKLLKYFLILFLIGGFFYLVVEVSPWFFLLLIPLSWLASYCINKFVYASVGEA